VVDPSVKTLTELKRRFALANLEGAFQQCHLEKTPFQDAHFDAVLCINALEFSDDPRQLLNEITRLLIPGGHAVVSTFNRFSFWGISPIARLTRLDDRKIEGSFLDKSMFEHLLSKSSLTLSNLVARAHYMPLGGICLKFKLPVPGAYVALVQRKLKN